MANGSGQREIVRIEDAINDMLTFLRQQQDLPIPQPVSPGDGAADGQWQAPAVRIPRGGSPQAQLDALAKELGAVPLPAEEIARLGLPPMPDPLGPDDEFAEMEEEPELEEAEPAPERRDVETVAPPPPEPQEPSESEQLPPPAQAPPQLGTAAIAGTVNQLVERVRASATIPLPPRLSNIAAAIAAGRPDEDRVRALESRIAYLEARRPKQNFRPKLLPDMEGLAWGKPTANWSSGNSITLDPCNEDGDDIAGATNVTAYIVSPYDKAITYAELLTTDIVGYLPYGQNKGLIVTVLRGGTCTSPKAMLPAIADTELTAAQTDTWSRASQGANDGFTKVEIQRMAFDHTEGPPPKLYAYYRTVTYDSLGATMTMSAETRVEVDVTEACP